MIDMSIRKRYAIAVALNICVAIILGFVAGYRPFGIGRDYINYLDFYTDIRPYDALSYFRFEPGFVVLAAFSKLQLNLGYSSFAALIMTASLLIKFFVLSKLHRPIPAILFYIVCWYPIHENTQIRVAFAISLLFLATRYMFQQRWGVFASLVFLASMFHTTAVAGAIVLLTAYLASNWRLFYSIVAVGLSAALLSAALPLIFPFLVQMNALIELADVSSQKPNVFSILNIAIVLFLLCSLVSGSLSERTNRTFYIVTLAGFAAFLAFISVPVLAHRLREMLTVFMVFIAFEYRITWKTLPQATLALTIAGGALYSSAEMGLFSN